MGKKPVLGLVGLVWAGIALTGCGTCQNCNNPGNSGKYAATPTWSTKGKDSTGAGIIPTPNNSSQISDSGNTGASPLSKTSDVASSGGMGIGRGDATPVGGKGLPPSGSVTGGSGASPVGMGTGSDRIPAPPSLPGSPQTSETLRPLDGPPGREYPGTSGGFSQGQPRDVSGTTGFRGGSDFGRSPSFPTPPPASPANGGPPRMNDLPPSSGTSSLPPVDIRESSISARPGAPMATSSVPSGMPGGSLPPPSGSSLPPPPPSGGSGLPQIPPG
jgi:hypothetical protein